MYPSVDASCDTEKRVELKVFSFGTVAAYCLYFTDPRKEGSDALISLIRGDSLGSTTARLFCWEVLMFGSLSGFGQEQLPSFENC